MRKPQAGMTLIEVMIAVTIMGLLLMIGAPSLTAFTQNQQIRTAAESVLGGVQLARAEAIKSNAQAMFSLTTSIDDSCAFSGTGSNWVVSGSDPTGDCGSSSHAQVIQKQAAAEAMKNAAITATQNNAAQSGQIAFNGFGRVTPNQAADIKIDIKDATGANCGTGSSNRRCLRVVISPGGMVRLCDSNVTYSLTNSQGC